jgi:ArsR family transcriptional regulator
MPTLTSLPPTPTRVKGCCLQLPDPIPAEVVEDAATVLRALSDGTRLQMLAMLEAAREPICVCDFTAAFDLGQPTVSHHLARLRDAGLVTSTKRGIWAFYELAPALPAVARAVLTALS